LVLGLVTVGLTTENVLSIEDEQRVTTNTHRDRSGTEVDIVTLFDLTVIFHEDDDNVAVQIGVGGIRSVTGSQVRRHGFEGHNNITIVFVISDGSADIIHGLTSSSLAVNITEGVEVHDITIVVHLEHGGKDWCLRGWIKIGPTAHVEHVGTLWLDE